jgi:two-component system sensor histidine kinase AtoS
MENREEFLANLEEIIASTHAAEKEFKQMKETMDEVIEFLPNPLWVLNKSGEFFLINSEAKNLSNLYSKIDLNKSDYEIEDDDKIYLIKIKKSEKSTIINAIDITKQKREERLASMGQVSAHLAHEIRNPIGSISILASTLLSRVDIKNKLMVMEIKKAIYRVERIIKSTLLFTKGVQANKRVISLEELKEEIENSFDFYSFTKDIELEMELGNGEIYGDFDLLSIVFQNFLYNALDAIEESEDDEGVVTIEYQKKSNHDIFIIKDTGIPIKDKNILYEPFKTTKLKGHGLGLALSLEIIKAHNGFVELLEEEKGFRIYLEKVA